MRALSAWQSTIEQSIKTMLEGHTRLAAKSDQLPPKLCCSWFFSSASGHDGPIRSARLPRAAHDGRDQLECRGPSSSNVTGKRVAEYLAQRMDQHLPDDVVVTRFDAVLSMPVPEAPQYQRRALRRRKAVYDELQALKELSRLACDIGRELARGTGDLSSVRSHAPTPLANASCAEYKYESQTKRGLI